MWSSFCRFGQLSTELSVVLFGLFFARLDSEKSIFRIMYLTIPISLVYTSIQVKLNSLCIIIKIHKNHIYFTGYFMWKGFS